MLRIRDVTADDLDRCLELNNAAIPAVPHMQPDELGGLIAASDHSYGVVDDDAPGAPILGFVLAMLPGRDYASENYVYFASRSSSFLYIDRIVVDAAIRGAGLGRMLYQRAFDLARTAALVEVTCEVNVRPPNPESMAFHARMGFLEVGRQQTKGGTYEVALLAASVV